MIIPDKNITLENSLLGSGMVILQKLSPPQTISSLWERTRSSSINSYEKFILSVDLLYMLDIIELHEGMVSKKYDKSS